jgi:hypothetical protein
MTTISRALPRPTYALDTVNGQPVVIAAQPMVDRTSISIDVWSLDDAIAIQADKERIAAEYERDGAIADRDGRIDGPIFRAMASSLLTQAADLFELLNGAQAERKAA